MGRLTTRSLQLATVAAAVAVVAGGAGFALVAGLPLADGAVPSLAPALGLVVVVGMARGRRAALWSALVGAALVVGLGAALYAAALRPEARASAPDLAASFVPLRQLAAVAVVAWAVWLTRRLGAE